MTLELDVQAKPPIQPSPNQAWLRALEMTGRLAEQPSRTLPVVIEELAERFGDAPALLDGQQSLTFRELAQTSNRYSRWALEQRHRRGRLRMPADAEPTGVCGHMARHLARRRHRGPAQHEPPRCFACALRRRGQAATRDRRQHAAVGSSQPPSRPSIAAPNAGRMEPMHPGSRASSPRCRDIPAIPSAQRSGPQSWPRTAPSTSIPRARPGCPRPPTSAIAAS